MSLVDAPMAGCLLRRAAQHWPDRPALAALDSRSFTFAALDAAVQVAAEQLRARGWQPGDTLAIHGPPDARAVVAVLAGLRTGLRVCPLNRRNPPELLREQVLALGARGVWSEDSNAFPLPKGILWESMQVLPREPVGMGADAPAPAGGAWTWSDPAEPATLLFTSGTTATPKIAVHSYANHAAAAAAALSVNALRPGDGWWLSLPLYHVGGLAILFRCLAAGATVWVPPAGAPLESAFNTGAITHLSLVPTQLQRLMAVPASRAALARLRAILLGGAPLPAALLAEAVAAGAPVCATYGLTEMCSQVATVPAGAQPSERLRPPAPLPGVALRVAPDGELWVNGPMRFLGYWAHGRLVAPFDAAGGFATGDLGARDAAGGVSVTGRRDNMFISGGENIQPEEIEAALAAVPGVADAVVLAVPDATFGRRPAAFVRTASDGAPDVAGLRIALESRLPRYKIPVWIRPWPPAAAAVDSKQARRAALEWAAAAPEDGAT